MQLAVTYLAEHACVPRDTYIETTVTFLHVRYAVH